MSAAVFLFHTNILTNIKYLRNDKLRGEVENGCEQLILFPVDLGVINNHCVHARLEALNQYNIESPHNMILQALTASERSPLWLFLLTVCVQETEFRSFAQTKNQLLLSVWPCC